MFIRSILIWPSYGKTEAATVPSARLAFSHAAKFAVEAWGGTSDEQCYMKMSAVRWCAFLPRNLCYISLKTRDYLRQTARAGTGTAKQADTIDGREPILYTGGALEIAHPWTPQPDLLLE